MAMLQLEEPGRNEPPRGFALFALGFRPFYLLAAAFAAIAVPVWVLVLAGVVNTPLPGVWWHAHEMLFGFAAAVIIGFLFTAGRNWTGLDTPSGAPLAALALLWLAGRLAMALGSGPWAAAVDFAFLPVAGGALMRVMVRAGSRRNYVVGALPLLLATANLFFHLAAQGVIALDPLAALHAALALVVMLESLIAGRVVPMFTFNAVRGVKQWRNPKVEMAAVVATLIALAAWVFGAGAWAAALSLLAAVLQLLRVAGWNGWAARGQPLLWVLHLSVLWIPAGLALLAAAQLGWLPRSAAIHALAIGATGGLIIGMITRTALGHTGRMLKAGKLETAAYVLVHVAAFARVTTLIAVPGMALGGIHLAATAWALAFLLYLVRYLPWLSSPRVDGRPG
jgi:uncharacterized protein involved in response to NO